jgi:hypothetical protein
MVIDCGSASSLRQWAGRWRISPNGAVTELCAWLFEDDRQRAAGLLCSGRRAFQVWLIGLRSTHWRTIARRMIATRCLPPLARVQDSSIGDRSRLKASQTVRA